MSATEELRRLLDERGVEWGNIRNDGSESDYLTEWQFDGIEGHAIATEWSVGHLTICIAHPMSPEEAIAATLGKEPDDAAMVKLHNRMNAALLEYERVQGIEQRDGDGGVVVPFVAEMHRLLEEAATLGQGACHDKNGFDPSLGFECTVCGTMVDEYMTTPMDYGRQEQFRYCPGCGARVVRL